MFPLWILITFYALSAAAVASLAYRLWKKSRSQRKFESYAMRPAELAAPRNPPHAAAMPSQNMPRIQPEQTSLVGNDGLYFGPLTEGMADLLPDTDSRRETLRQELQTAGYYSPHAMTNFSAIRYALMMAFLILGGVLLILVPRAWEPFAIGAVVVGPMLGWSLPRLHVRSRAAQRKSEIERAMPDLLDMLNMCVAQGLTVPDALRRILPDLDSVYPALAQELRIVMEQTHLGSLPQALKNFDRRIDLPEVHSFTSLLMQTDRMGTSISEALTTYSDSMRESLKQRVDEKGNRATFRLLFPTVFCLMPAVYLFLLGPAIIGMSDFFQKGGRGALDQGSRTIQRLNETRTASTGPGVTQDR